MEKKHKSREEIEGSYKKVAEGDGTLRARARVSHVDRQMTSVFAAKEGTLKSSRHLMYCLFSCKLKRKGTFRSSLNTVLICTIPVWP